MQNLDAPFIAPKSGGKAKSLVIFLHGYGANGDDLLSIGTQWQEELPDTAFIAPNAPEPCEGAPFGFQWFPIRAIDRDYIEREQQVEKVAPVLNGFIDQQLRDWKVDDTHLAVVGFSQGAMMAMYTMPRRPNPCAAVIGYSGMLVDAKGLVTATKVPVLAVHGSQDQIVPPSCLVDVEEGFSAAGFDVETILRPHLAHGIDQFGLVRGVEFIKEHFEKADKLAA